MQPCTWLSKGVIILPSNNEPSLKPTKRPKLHSVGGGVEQSNLLTCSVRSLGVASFVKFPPSPPLHSRRGCTTGALARARSSSWEPDESDPAAAAAVEASSLLRAVWHPRGCLSLLKQSGDLLDLLGQSGPHPSRQEPDFLQTCKDLGQKTEICAKLKCCLYSHVARIIKFQKF